MELRYGASKRDSERLTRQLESILSELEILPLEDPADRHYGKLRTYLEKQGATIEPNDMLIATQGLALDCVVITANTREFSRVPGLRVEN